MIGFEAYSDQGPGIFLTRLQQALEKRGQFSLIAPSVWIQLSFQVLPQWIQERRDQGKTRVLVRMDGCYCSRFYKIRQPFVLPITLLDNWYSAKVNRKKNRQIRENLLGADTIVFQSEFSRALTQRFVTPTAPGIIIYNGVDLDAFSLGGPMSPLCLPQTINILVSHSFRPYHRLHDVFRILAELVHHSPRPYHLHILGNDDESNAFNYARTVANALRLREGLHYTFHGKLPHSQLPEFYRACDLMLNLSYWDTCPNVVVEALACGLPVVGVNHGGVAELVGATGGLLVDEAIPMTWVDHRHFEKMPQAPIPGYVNAILKLCENLEAFSDRARSTAIKRFDIEKVCDEYLLAAHQLEQLWPSSCV